MSEVSLIPSGLKAAAGAGAAADVHAHTTLRLQWRVGADHGAQPYIRLYIETAPTDSGPWTAIHEKRIKSGEPAASPDAWPSDGQVRAAIVGHEGFIRGRWEGAATLPGEPAFNIELRGDAKPDA